MKVTAHAPMTNNLESKKFTVETEEPLSLLEVMNKIRELHSSSEKNTEKSFRVGQKFKKNDFNGTTYIIRGSDDEGCIHLQNLATKEMCIIKTSALQNRIKSRLYIEVPSSSEQADYTDKIYRDQKERTFLVEEDKGDEILLIVSPWSVGTKVKLNKNKFLNWINQSNIEEVE